MTEYTPRKRVTTKQLDKREFMKTFTIGQELWFIPRYSRAGRYIKIEKFGRAWIHCTGGARVDPETLEVSSLHLSGQCHLDKEAYEAKVRCDRLWSTFRAELSKYYSKPVGVEELDIHQAAELLKIRLK